MLQQEGVQPEKKKMQLEIPDNQDEWEQAARAAAARPGIGGIITDIIDRLAEAGRPVSDSLQSAGPSETYHPPVSSVQLRRD